jgi:hypothetical protein
LIPALGAAGRKVAQAEVAARLALTGMGLDRFRLAHGRLPSTLDELVPRYLNSVPADPCGDQRLRYRVTGDGKFVLYSVGWNEKDDGGVIARKEQQKDRQLDVTEGDWVWTY